MPKDAKVDVVLQRIEEDIGEEISVVPEKVRRYGVNNIFSRVFGYLIGWTTANVPVKIRATTAGILKVASTGAGLEDVTRNPTTDTDGLVAVAGVADVTETFSAVQSVIDIYLEDFDLYVKFSKDGVAFSENKLLKAGVLYSWDLAVKAVTISNVDDDASHDGSFEVVGYA